MFYNGQFKIAENMQSYAVAAGHPLTARAAEQILQQGGNAYDAVIAAVLMSFVSEPLLSSPGGGGFLMVAGPNQEPKLLDFFSNTPLMDSQNLQQKEWDFYPISGDFGDKAQEFHVGRAAAAVPGVVAGIYKAHQTLASMPLSILAEPAIHAARHGVEVNGQQAFVADILVPITHSTKEAQRLYKNFKKGAVWKNQQLANFLDSLAQSSHDWFYGPEMGQYMYGSADCLLQAEDFEEYQCAVRKPLQIGVKDYQVYTNPAPSTGGLLIAEQLKNSQNNRNPASIFRAMQHMEKHKKTLLNTVSRGTTHISVADHAGNLASLTISNGEGNGHIVANCGFMMNNFLGESDINSEGFFNWQPGQRMRSMMAPTLLLNPHNSFALGSGGSNRIKTAIFQVISHLVYPNSLLKTAVESPRMHLEDNILDLEPGLSCSEIGSDLNSLDVIQWRAANLYFGGVNAVQTGDTVSAVGDYRRHGCGIIGLKGKGVSQTQ